MNYQEMSKEILKFVGGNGNIEAFGNCMTRLRINVKDTSKVDEEGLKSLKGVMGVIKGDQTQIIVGPGHAQRLKDAFGTVANITNQIEGNFEFDNLAGDMKAKVKATQTSKIQAVFRQIGNIFVPLIPGFVACGLIAAFVNIWKTMIDPSIGKNEWFLLIAAMGTLLGGMLNVLVGYNSSKEFGGTPVLGAIIGGFIYLPALNGIPAVGEIPAITLSIPFFNIALKSGLGGVIGVILAAYICTVIEKRIRKLVPASLDLFIVPFATIVLGAIVTLFVIMPISALLMQGLTYILVEVALKQGGIIGGYILSALFLPLVMLGIHQGLVPLHAQLIEQTATATSPGFSVLFPILAMAGAGQVGMAIAVLMKTKDKGLKTIIKNALPIGFLGIGEPLIYGVSLPLFYPFITACLGAGFGGAVLGFVNQNIGDLGAIAIGPSGLILIPLISNNLWLWFIVALLASYAGGFLLTYFFGYNEKMLEKVKK